MHRRFLTFLGIVLALVCSLATSHASAHPVAVRPSAEQRLAISVKEVDAVLQESWFGIYAGGKKVGFQQEAVEKVVEGGETVYRTRVHSLMKLVALGDKGEIKLEQSLVFASEPPFALLRGEFLSDDGKSTKRISLATADKGYEATIVIGKLTQKMTLNDVALTLADVVSPTLWLKKGPAKGDAITVADFNFADLRMSKVSMKLLDRKETMHEGAKALVSEVEKVEHRATSRETSIVRYDDNGRLMSGVVAGLFEFRRESEIEARKTEFSDDLIFATMVRLDRPVGDLAKVKGMTLKGKGELIKLLPQTVLQRIVHEGGDDYLIKIGKHHGTKVKATAKEIKDGLEASASHPINDARVIELAKSAVGDARTDREKVERLCRFVHQFIKYEIVYLPKIEDILERKVGDCKSYALLFTCLARAVGLPAREAAGYFYMGDEVKGFGGHAWNEVLIDGHWVPVDATIGLTDLVPFYISVGTGPDGMETMSRTMGRLSFALVDVERGR